MSEIMRLVGLPLALVLLVYLMTFAGGYGWHSGKNIAELSQERKHIDYLIEKYRTKDTTDGN